MIQLSTFLNGVITFISPCMLPMLPIYMTYFSGTGKDSSTKKALKNSIGFVLGFTTMFVLMGILASTLKIFLVKNSSFINILMGAIVIIFGLYYMGILKLDFLSKRSGPSFDRKNLKGLGFFSTYIFGVIFSVTWSACLTPQLGTALVMAASSDTVWEGAVLLVCYSLGLGIPFILSSLLLEQLKGIFTFIKKHYKIINTISGILLILLGFAMITGFLEKLLGILSWRNYFG